MTENNKLFLCLQFLGFRSRKSMATRVSKHNLPSRSKQTFKTTPSSRGTSLAVQWLRLCASAVGGVVGSLIRELKS